MKVLVLAPFFDDNGLHVKGDVIETAHFDDALMERIHEEKTEEPKKKKTVKK